MDASYRIKTLIEEKGKISLNRFMEEVISNCEYSYYNNPAIGSDGDFITSPEISQLFGEMIGVWCITAWEKLNYPSKLAIVELGPGNGILIDDFLRATKHVTNFHSSIELHFIEISERLKTIQCEKIEKYNIKKRWYKSLEEFSTDIPTVFIGNEFFDALPINQYKKSGQYWYKKYIEMNEKYEFNFTDVKTSDREEYDLNLEFKNIEDGGIVEISKKSIKYIKHMSQIIKDNSGCGLIIDYGYFIKNFDRIKTNSTLQAIKNHQYSSALSNIGRSDITAHVDFYKLVEMIKLYNLNYSICSQKDFLINQGINIRAQNLIKNSNFETQDRIYKNLDTLISPDKMGELFKVLIIY